MVPRQPPTPELDLHVRLAAFAFLEQARRVHGDVVPFRVLAHGFRFGDEPVALLNAVQGIFTPRQITLPISLTTAPAQEGRQRPYDDRIGTDGLISYRYRGLDPNHRDNAGVRRLFETRTPLIYFHGVEKGLYWVCAPVFVVSDQPDELTFGLQADEPIQVVHYSTYSSPPGATSGSSETELRRRYVTVAVQRRLHQAPFQQRVLRAYREHCAVCRLRQKALLDAAHIVPDSEGGEPRVDNGLALCKLHHAAFDSQILGIRPDRVVEIRREILDETDGPMLVHGLQELHGHDLVLPRARKDWPREEFLEQRYALFRKAQ